MAGSTITTNILTLTILRMEEASVHPAPPFLLGALRFTQSEKMP